MCVSWEVKGMCEVDVLLECHVTVYNSQRNNMYLRPSR